MILVTGCNESYQHRMNAYLDTLQAHADFQCYFVGVGFMPIRSSERVTAVTISREENEGAPARTECIQHGSFLAAVPSKATEVIMYTDGDFLMQRQMDDSERELLKLKKGQVLVGYNGSATETLQVEAARLGQKIVDADMTAKWGDGWQELPIYNVGCVAMTRATWQTLHKVYTDRWQYACDSFTHQARQQWLISWVIGTQLKPLIMPWSLHAHGHFGMKPGMGHGEGGIWADGKLALFRHFI
jgi:hypothetical protein